MIHKSQQIFVEHCFQVLQRNRTKGIHTHIHNVCDIYGERAWLIFKELSHMITEAEMSQICSQVNWRPKRGNSVNSVMKLSGKKRELIGKPLGSIHIFI